MKPEEMLLKKEERVSFSLRALFEQYGYRKFKMSKFEEYDFYAENRSFLHSEAILTFTGLDGKLLALKPDVTLSIVKNTKGSRDTAERVYYNENVYRARKGAGEYKEIMQVGLEYIGEVDAYATLEVLLLAQKSLKAISDAYILDVSHMGFVAGLMEEVALPYAQQDRILDCISEKNIHGIRAVCKENGVAANLTEKLEGLASLYGSLEETLPQAKALCCNEKMEQAVQELENILRCLKIGGNEEKVNLDFSIVNDMDYYTGIIFQGFINGVPSSILSGGRYDNLLRKLGKDADAVICLGAVIRGSTSHYDFVCNEVSKGIAAVSLETDVPVMFGVLTTENIEQAIERAGTKAGNKGYDCAVSAIEMVNLIRELEK